MVNPIVRKHFAKFGLSLEVLQTLSALVMSSAVENATDEEIAQSCGNFDALAKSFQKEVVARVEKERKTHTAGNENKGNSEEVETPEAGASDNPQLAQLVQAMTALTATVNDMKTEKLSKAFRETVVEKLKEIKMSDAEIKVALFDRKFNSAEEVENFVAGQQEAFAEVLQTRADTKFDNNQPPAGGASGKTTSSAELESYKAELEAFNAKF